MKIIQQGNPNYLKHIRRFTCKCGCVFEAEKGEYTVDSQYNEEYYSCECPTCKSMVYQSEAVRE